MEKIKRIKLPSDIIYDLNFLWRNTKWWDVHPTNLTEVIHILIDNFEPALFKELRPRKKRKGVRYHVVKVYEKDYLWLSDRSFENHTELWEEVRKLILYYNKHSKELDKEKIEEMIKKDLERMGFKPSDTAL